jgi:hypothetical protein
LNFIIKTIYNNLIMKTRIEKINISDPDYIRYLVKPMINLLVSGLGYHIKENKEFPENDYLFMFNLMKMNEKIF